MGAKQPGSQWPGRMWTPATRMRQVVVAVLVTCVAVYMWRLCSTPRHTWNLDEWDYDL